MKSLLVLISCFLFSTADFDVNWSVDENTVPELLPALMRNEFYSDEEINKAVFWAYKFQYDVISEHNGHVFDAKTPLGYFKDKLNLPKTRVSSIYSDIIFSNNTVCELNNFKRNKIIIKWSQDRVSTEVIWKEIRIEGTYAFLDDLRFINTNYQIIVEDVTYRADTPLSKNVEFYPSSAPNTAISYSKFKVTFIGDYSISNEYSAIQYFLEEVAFRHVADSVMETTRQNVTSAIRAAVQPYVMFKNRSDPHLPGASGRTGDGRVFVVSNTFTSGVNNAVQKIKAVWTEPGAVMVAAENTLHHLSGTFDLRIYGASTDHYYNGTVDFAIGRVRMSVTFDALKPNCRCATAVRVYGTSVRPAKDDDDDLYATKQQAAAAFVNAVADHLSTGICAAIVKANRHSGVGGNGPFCASSLL